LIMPPALAQTTPDSSFDSTAVPSAQDLLPPSESEAFDSAPAEPFTPEPIAPEPIAPELTTPEPAPSDFAEPGSRSVDLELSTPSADAPSELDGSAPLVTPNLVDQAEAAFGQGAPGNIIDSTSYSLGATDNPNVILSERSTGCETVMQLGQNAPNSVCSFGGVGETPYFSGMEGFNVAGGDLGLSVVYGGRTTPSASDYYNLTIRPPARLSLGNVNLLFPLSIPAAITSAFGWRIHPVMGSSRFHAGTDLGAPQGTPVLAAFSGKVAIADFMGGYGLAVVVRHQKDTEETLYGHLSEIFVKPGETVKQGEVIGRVGSTGLSTGPHLHFEFRKQTPNGWVVMDAGGALDFALSQFVTALRLGQPYPPQLAAIRSASFTKALEMAQADSQEQARSEQAQVEQAQNEVDPAEPQDAIN
jgi:murein DD-endopeptidase MepM/ murein hydrolase activator NlpD